MNRLSLCAALLLSFFPVASFAVPIDATRFAHAMDAYVAPLVAGDQLSGELLVAQNGHIVLELLGLREP